MSLSKQECIGCFKKLEIFNANLCYDCWCIVRKMPNYKGRKNFEGTDSEPYREAKKSLVEMYCKREESRKEF
jgi:hypothetical protein